jgi:dihydrofolate synthase/folylpolyglutamate synthase
VKGPFLSYNNTLDYLYNLQSHGIQLGLDRIELLLSILGYPQHQFPSVHIGGTNGKGSTAAMTASILEQAGYRVGLYTSPCLTDLSEQIMVNGAPISQDEIVRLTGQLRAAIQSTSLKITFFELITAMAFCYFAEANVDIAVVEVGLGGRFDATNVLTPQVTAITQIDFDHELYLGTTLLDIAKEKAGIIKEGTLVITGATQPEVQSLFQEIAHSKNAPLLQLGRDITLSGDTPHAFLYSGIYERTVSCPLLGKHQMANAAIALSIIEQIQPPLPEHRGESAGLSFSSFPISEQAILEGIRTVKWPGRLQVIRTDPLILLDGAHNPSGAVALSVYLRHTVDPHRLGQHFMIMGILQDKNIREILLPQVGWADEIVLTRPAIERAADPELLLAVLEGPVQKTIRKTVLEAIEYVESKIKPNDTLVISGSLYTVSEALAYYKGVTLSPVRG